MYLPLITGPVQALGYKLEKSTGLDLAKHFVSDEFGHEKRVKYLNYIRADKSKEGLYTKGVSYLVNHPVLAKRLVVTADIAFRALQVSAAAIASTFAASALGLSAPVSLALTATMAVPLATKLLAAKWDAFKGVDNLLNHMVLVAGSVQSVIATFSLFDTLAPYLGSYVGGSLIPAFTPLVVGFSRLLDDVGHDSKKDWKNFLNLIDLDNKFKTSKLSQNDISDGARALQNHNFGYHNNHDLSNWKELDKLHQNLKIAYGKKELSYQFNEFTKSHLELMKKMESCSPTDIKTLEAIVSNFRSLANFRLKVFCNHIQDMDRAFAIVGRKGKEWDDYKTARSNHIETLKGLLSVMMSEFQSKMHGEPLTQMLKKLENIDPAKEPKKYIDTYLLCLHLLDPFEEAPAFDDFYTKTDPNDYNSHHILKRMKGPAKESKGLTLDEFCDVISGYLAKKNNDRFSEVLKVSKGKLEIAGKLHK